MPRLLSVALLVALTVTLSPPAARSAGKLKITVVDKDSGEPIPFRMHLKNRFDVPQKAPRAPFFKDHFVSPGEVTLTLRRGVYTFEVERGLEYLWQKGYFEIRDNADDEKVIELRRFINMADLGWYSGDLHVHRPVKDIELLMQADDLQVAPVITWWNKKNEWAEQAIPDNLLVNHDKLRYYHVMAGEDERGGGALLYFGLKKPLEISTAQREYPCSAEYLQKATDIGNVWVDIEKPFWWDVPLWLSTGQCHSIGIANNHMCRSQMYPDEAWGRPRDKLKYRDKLGNAYYSQDIYYHILNCGLKIPPSAGSASGVLPNPVGYNRVYVHVDGEFTWDKWWEGLRQGHSFVTNGPLIMAEVQGKLPGHVFSVSEGEEITLQPYLTLKTRDKIRYLEVIKNGKVLHTVRLEEYAKAQGRLPELTFTESGWFLIRAIAENDTTFRFASTAPYFVRIGGENRISRASARFFVDWEKERIANLEEALKDPVQRGEVLRWHQAALKFWQDILKKANVD